MNVSSKSILVVSLLGLMGTLPGCGGGSSVGDSAEQVFTQGTEIDLVDNQGLESMADEVEQFTNIEEEYAEESVFDTEVSTVEEEAFEPEVVEVHEETVDDTDIVMIALEQEPEIEFEQPESLPVQVSVEVSWDIPTQRENGSDLQLSELDGYQIIYFREGSSGPGSIYIDSPTQSSEIIEDLEPGEYRFKISAIDTNGLVSEYSQVVTTTLQ